MIIDKCTFGDKEDGEGGNVYNQCKSINNTGEREAGDERESKREELYVSLVMGKRAHRCHTN